MIQKNENIGSAMDLVDFILCLSNSFVFKSMFKNPLLEFLSAENYNIVHDKFTIITISIL